MKKKPVFSTLIICFLLVLLYQCISDIPVNIVVFKETFATVRDLTEAGESLDEAMLYDVMNGVIDKANEFIYKYQYEIMLFSSSVFILGIFAFKKFNAERIEKDLRIKSFSPGHLGMFAAIAFALDLVAMFVTNMAVRIIPDVANSQESFAELAENITSNPWLGALYSVIFAPVAEELLCRGLIMQRLRKAFSPIWVMILSGVFFGIMHSSSYQFIYTVPLGMFFAYLVYAYDSILPSIIVHGFYNASIYLFDIPEALGYAEGSVEYKFIYFASMLLLVIAVPIALLAIKNYMPHPDLEAIRERDEEENSYYQNNGSERNYYPYNTNTAEENGEMAIDYIVAGLGNPGTKYVQNRHNIGFLALDYIGIRESFGTPRERFRALTYEKEISGKRILFMKPQTMMNLSGESVGEAARYYKIPADRIIVIYDDVNFDAGVMRIRKNGSAGGHNGIKNIIANLHTEEFPRIKIGVGKLPEDRDMISWVLGDPCEADMNLIVGNMESVYSALKLMIDGKTEEAQQRYN